MTVAKSLSDCIPALVAPFYGGEVDLDAYRQLLSFQAAQGVKQALVNGTTGESPTLSEGEQDRLVSEAASVLSVVAGTGGNCTRKAIRRSEAAVGLGADAVLLVDPYYNGPSSLEIRREYYEPVARSVRCPVIPYVIPGRCGCELSAHDLAELSSDCPNVVAVKEATGNIERMRLTRSLCPEIFIYSGDDDMTLRMVSDRGVRADGVISVAMNVAPAAVTRLVRLARSGDLSEASRVNAALSPLFSAITVKSSVPNRCGGATVQKFRNPLPYKTLMAGLGMIPFGCRQPLGRMDKAGVEYVRAAARKVWEENPWVLEPIGRAFGVDVSDRLARDENWCVYYG